MTEHTDPPLDASAEAAEPETPEADSLPVRGDSDPAEAPAGPHDAGADGLVGDFTDADIDLDFTPGEDVDGGDD